MRRDEDTNYSLSEDQVSLLRLRGGEWIEAGGDKPVVLDDLNVVWVVISGKMDVFSARVAEGQAAGPRRHLCRIEAGRAVLGMDLSSAPEGLRVLAVGVAGTTLLKLERSRLVELAKEPECAGLAVRLLEGWLQNLSAAAVADEDPQSEEPAKTLAPDQEVELEDRSVVRAERRETVWVRHLLGGGSRFLGDADLPPVDGDRVFPLAGPAWLESDGNTALLGLDTADYVAQDGRLSGLDTFHATVLPLFARDARRAASERQERLRERVEADRKLARNAVRRLGAVFETRPSSSASSDSFAVEGGDPLLAACRVVGRALGVELRRPERPQSEGQTHDSLDEISRASRVRTRRVTLQGDWWRKDGGPLLGFWSEDEQPVALLPSGAAAYAIVDPADGTRRPVDREIASGLALHGYTFYPPFPDRPLGVLDLLKYSLRSLRRDILMVLLMGVAGGLLGALVPIAANEIVSVGIPQAEGGLVAAIALGLVVAAVSAMLFEVVRAFAVQRIETRLDSSVQSAVWDRLLGLPATFFRGYAAGDLTTRAMGINTIRQMVTGATVSSLLSGVFSLFSFGVVFYFSVRLGLLATLMAVAIIGVTVAAGYVQLRYQRRTTELQGELSSLVLQLLSGIAKLRVAGAETRAFAVWAGRYSAQRTNAVKAQAVSNALIVFNSASGVLTLLVIFAAVAYFAWGDLSTGEFVAFNAAFAQFLIASAGISTAFTTIMQAAPYYERAKPILRATPEVDADKPDPGALSGRVEVSHVSLRYDPDSPLVLEDVSLRAEPGEFVAIVGPSGAGKSSLFRLMLGFETAEAGSVYYDDHDLSGINVQAVRRQMGVVLQNGKLMSGTIFQNIAGVSGLSVDEAWEAARLAGLDADIEAMPMGIFTILGEGTSTISGGQRQRLMIARAIASRPRILLFDEATSALDNRTQAIVSSSLEQLQATRIVIAHRLSTIMNADRIYVLQGGRIAQTGKYTRLMEEEGPFRHLAARQIA